MLTSTMEANVMRIAQCHEVEQEEFQFIFCLIIKYFNFSEVLSTGNCSRSAFKIFRRLVLCDPTRPL